MLVSNPSVPLRQDRLDPALIATLKHTALKFSTVPVVGFFYTSDPDSSIRIQCGWLQWTSVSASRMLGQDALRVVPPTPAADQIVTIPASNCA